MLGFSDGHDAQVDQEEAHGGDIHGVEVDEGAGEILLDEWEPVDEDDSLVLAAAGADCGYCDKVVEKEED